RRPIGDATVVFWADAGNAEAAEAAEGLFAIINDPPDDAEEARKIAEVLDAIARGRAVSDLRPAITPGTKFHVLGLSPNAARLSVRFWLTDDFEVFARNLAAHFDDLRMEPRPFGWSGAPGVNRLLAQTTALQGKFENIPALLAGEVMRSVLTGARYPQSLLAAVIMRLRAGDDPLTGWHSAVIRAVLTRDHRKGFQKEDVPVSLAPDEPNKAYQLGRLFAVLETAQRMALGKINATIRDRYFGAASATPARVFPLLLRGVQNHLARLRKDGKGAWLEREIEDILGNLTLDLPRSLPLAEQGRFAVGYYHQRKEQFKGRPDVDGDDETGKSEDDA
ncbi:type I-C CRISPR-associated protein Cas8c/Csd1, partial [Telmatospirillum sp.]|uniref:type I-C CRISPR-associated protein Cas8c/Csd1 n=1 Tax=Telmatospirillum sp. TaxID=2079197 RepID=UPI00284A033F